MEKYLLRKAFDDPESPYLPESVLWRQKEQFSDGVGYDWVDGLKEYAESMVSDAEWDARATRCEKRRLSLSVEVERSLRGHMYLG